MQTAWESHLAAAREHHRIADEAYGRAKKSLELYRSTGMRQHLQDHIAHTSLFQAHKNAGDKELHHAARKAPLEFEQR